MTYMHFLFDLVHVIKLHVTHNMYASDLFLELHQYLYATKPTQVLHLSAHKHSCFLVFLSLGGGSIVHLCTLLLLRRADYTILIQSMVLLRLIHHVHISFIPYHSHKCLQMF
jgi:hypothetical protein